MKKEQLTTAQIKANAQAKLAALGFKKEKTLGLAILDLSEGESVAVQITSDVEVFETKQGKKLDYVNVTNLESGESDMTLWLSGQLKHTFQSQKDGFIGGKFLVSHLGKQEVEIDGETRYVNQYEVMAIS